MSSAPYKPSAIRKSHRKSRTGCVMCKTRRIKCDEDHPQCLNCSRRGLSCHFPVSIPRSRGGRPRKQRDLSRPPSDSTGEGGAGVDIPSLLLGNEFPSLPHLKAASASSATAVLPFKVEEMSLMHHYTAYTYSTLANRSDIINIYQQVAPSTAFSDPPLLCSLLAMAALHRSYLSTEAQAQDRYFDVATSYQNSAIQAYRERIPHITRANACSLFFFSSFLAVYIMGSESMLNNRNGPGDDAVAHARLTFEAMFDWLRLLRGIPSILRQGDGAVFAWVTEGPLAPLAEYTNLPAAAFKPAQTRRWARLRAALVDEADVPEQDERQAYVEALQMLRDYVGFLLGDTANIAEDGSCTQVEVIGLTMTWPAIVSERYIGYLGLRRPGALVLLAQYAVLMNGLGDLWWAKGWGEALLHLVRESVPEKWGQLIENVIYKAKP